MAKAPRCSKRGSTGTPAAAALTRAGVQFTVHTYEHDPRQRSFGSEAATALQLEPATIFKTLIVDVDDVPTVAIVPVSSMLDLKAHAASCGGRRAALADEKVAERITGYVVGGISPIGQKRKLQAILDNSATELATVYVSGGVRGMQIGLSPRDLIEITDAISGPIARFP